MPILHLDLKGGAFRSRSICRTRPVEQPAIRATSAACIWAGLARIFSPPGPKAALRANGLFRWIREGHQHFSQASKTCFNATWKGCATKLEFFPAVTSQWMPDNHGIEIIFSGFVIMSISPSHAISRRCRRKGGKKGGEPVRKKLGSNRTGEKGENATSPRKRYGFFEKDVNGQVRVKGEKCVRNRRLKMRSSPWFPAADPYTIGLRTAAPRSKARPGLRIPDLFCCAGFADAGRENFFRVEWPWPSLDAGIEACEIRLGDVERRAAFR